MTDQQPDALRLADALETLSPLERDAAAELRRLHSVNAQLLEALGHLEEYSKRVGNVASNLAAAAAEREACAKVIDDLSLAHPGRADLTALQCAAAIRARGQQ